MPGAGAVVQSGRARPTARRTAYWPARSAPPGISAPEVAAPPELRPSTSSPSYLTLCGPTPAHA
eukprot:8719051-Alexandrium_andersonii.AAC.1